MLFAHSSSAKEQPKPLYEAPLQEMPVLLFGEAKIAGESCKILFDTGSVQDVFLDPVLAKKFGPVVREGPLGGETKPFYKVPAVSLGNLTAPAGERASFDLGLIRTAIGTPLMGVAGWKLLKGRTLVVDHDKHVLRLTEGSPDPAGYEANLPVEDVKGHPFIQASVAGADLKLMIDSGADSAVSLEDSEFDRLKEAGLIREQSIPGKVVHSSGVGSRREGWFQSGSLLGVDLKGMPVANTAPGMSQIGGLFLLKFNYALSGDSMRFCYSLRKDPETPISVPHSLGALIAFSEGHGVVLKLSKTGLATKSGLMEDDVILNVGQPAGQPVDAVVLYKFIKNAVEKPQVIHGSRNGRDFVMTLQLETPVSAWNPNPNPK